MNSYKLKIQYNGFHFIGWQVQPNGETIQGTLNNCLKKLSKSEDIKTVGSGRTDSGVHALGQVVKIEMPLQIDTTALVKALNTLLPDSIRVLEAEVCGEDFHPIFSAKKKEYLYAFTLNKNRSPFIGELMARYPHRDFDQKRLEEACRLFEGEHDFCNYFCTGTPVKSTVRTIFNCSVVKEPVEGFYHVFDNEHYLLRFEGTGFLKQMVRLMVGALWATAAGKCSLQDIENSLKNPLDSKLAAVAPPQGLYLNKVHY